MIDDEAGEGDDNHHRCLFPFTLVDDNETEGKGWDEEKGPIWGHRFLACYGRRGMFVDHTEYRGANCDTEAKKEGVNDGVNHADAACNDITGLKLKGTADKSFSQFVDYNYRGNRGDLRTI